MEASNTGQSKATTLLLLIERDRNRELLADQLGNEFNIQTAAQTPFDYPQYDICLFDTSSLKKFQDSLRGTKTDAEPAFLPHLLLTKQQSPAELSDDVWDIVDEVIQRPVNRRELDARINNLLHRRRLSVELVDQKEHSEQRFKSLFQSTPDPVIVVSPEGTITEVNDAFVRIFGVDPYNLKNQSITELELSPSDVVERVLLRIADEEPASTTINWELEGKEILVTELNTEVVRGFGDAVERIGIFRDITARVQREQELERQNERLEEFAKTVAHDLRNPLSVARGRLELARDSGGEEHFDAISSAHERMDQMIEELLVLAKQGQAVHDPSLIVLPHAADQAWSHVKTRGATLETDVDESAMITADEGRLCGLLENLFRNAIEHDGEEVTVRVGSLSSSDGFYIEDDGPGIPPAEQSDIFEAGYSNSPDGTGFGLSIVQQIVNGHGWDITVTESTSGGARFEISNVDLDQGPVV
ncbi:nitrogen regulation protein NR(II) [Haloarcula sp. JP-L23]|uniref:two-component system sensor histidine kinase NtrB n=1 Tax=Haloarcula sp. JP-L23 TaxID=2716717 RepID=UPI00140EDC42|nr:PAS domain S-box protein [Haloarcula sp. JP-L23]